MVGIERERQGPYLSINFPEKLGQTQGDTVRQRDKGVLLDNCSG